MTPRPVNVRPTVGERIDDVLGVFWPAWQARRAAARATADVYANSAWRGASNNRLTADWWASKGSADADLLIGGKLEGLRERARDLVQNDGAAAGMLLRLKDHTVGTGVRPQSIIDRDALDLSTDQVREFQSAAERAWDRWTEDADAEHKLDAYAQQRLIQGTLDLCGEVFLLPRRLPLRSPDGRRRRYMLAVQVIEPDRVSTPWGTSGKNPDTDNEIRGGVEINSDGQPVAYWLRKSHPGDTGMLMSTAGIADYIRIPAYDPKTGWPRVIHLFDPNRPGQSRGASSFAPVLGDYRAMADVNYFTLVLMKVAACITAFIKKGGPGSAAAQLTTSRNDTGQRLTKLEPASIVPLEQGEEIQQVTPQHPGGTFESFMRQTSRRACSAQGVPYEVAYMDYSQVNFASGKCARQDAQATFDVRQQTLARGLRPLWKMVLEEAFLNGELPVWADTMYPQNRDLFSGVQWNGPKLAYVQPDKEIAAADEAIRMGTSCLRDECVKQGKDWEDVLEQQAVEQQRRKELGLDPQQQQDPNAKPAKQGDAVDPATGLPQQEAA